MVSVNIVCVGKIKETFYKDAVAEYAKRLQRFCKFSIIETKEVPPKADGDAYILKSMEDEAQFIIPQLRGYVIVLAVEGKELDSVALSNLFKERMERGDSEITFVIGGSNGLSDKIKEKANFSLSFSKMTFPHMLARVMISEQIYRAFTIMNGIEYHK